MSRAQLTQCLPTPPYVEAAFCCLDASAKQHSAKFASLRHALIDDNRRYVIVVVCEADYRALKRGIGNLQPPLQ